MKNLKRVFDNLGIDGVIFGIASIASITIGVFSFVGSFFNFQPITGNQLSSVLIGTVGFLIAAVVALSAKRKNEIREIKDAIGISESELINSNREVEERFAFSARQAKRFILDTSLNRVIPDSANIAYFSGVESEYRRAIYERVKRGEVNFRRVEIIYHRQGLEWAIFRLLLHDNPNYQIRHFEPSDKPIPMISFLSFDNTTFYLGGFHMKGSPTEETALVIRDPNLSKILGDYWNVFWDMATPLNEGSTINWNELKQIGLRVGIEEQEFEKVVSKLKDTVAKERRKVAK